MQAKIGEVKIMSKKMKRSLSNLVNNFKDCECSLKAMSEHSFNIFEVLNHVKREDILPMMTFHSILSLRIGPLISETKMFRFLETVNQEYRKDV